MSEGTVRPVPKPNLYVPTEPFWQGAREGKLTLQFCRDSGRFQHYPRPVSLFTGKRNLEWREVSGRGTIYAFTILRVPGPGVAGRQPLGVVTVELDEKVRILGNLVDTPLEDVRIGCRVALAWDRLDDDTAYPAFHMLPQE